MTDELPQCPFCGSDQVRITDTTFETVLDGEEITMDFAECPVCYLNMPVGNYRVLCERIEKLKAQQMQPDFLSQALNEGDGTYRP
jgi:hypothetical protein